MMDTLFNCLSALTDRPLGTVVHIGGGCGSVLQFYARLAPTRTVLIEGDPTAASELQRNALGRPGIAVRPLVVGRAGAIAWNRFNLPALNGPLDVEALSAYYPRLRLLEQLDVEAVSLDEILGDIEVASDGDGLTVLVLDVPGQEYSLLRELSEPRLLAFDAVLLRGCSEIRTPWGSAAPEAVALLQQRCFYTEASDAESEPLWPVTLLRFDRSRYDAQQLRRRVEVLDAALDASQKAAAEQTRLANDRHVQLNERAQQIQALTQSKGELEKVAEERRAQLEALTAGKAAAEKLASERAAQIEQLGQAKAAAEKSATERATQIQQLTQARDEQAKAAAEQTRLAAERLAQLSERAQQIQTLTQSKGELEKAAAEREQRQRVLDLEILKAEAQLELIKDVLIREKNF